MKTRLRSNKKKRTRRDEIAPDKNTVLSRLNNSLKPKFPEHYPDRQAPEEDQRA